VHPPGAVVEPLVDEELAPRHRAVGIQALVAHHLQFRPEVKRGVGIDEQQRVMGNRVRGRDGGAVRSSRLGLVVLRRQRLGRRSFAVERGKLVEVHGFDIAADAAFGEAQRHPRLESPDDARLHLGVLVEVEIQAIGKCVHELAQPRGAGRVVLLHLRRVDEELHAQVLVDFRLAFGFGEAPHGVDVVRLDAIEVVFGLRVLHAEDRVGVGFSVDVRNAPIVPDDGDSRGLLAPARQFGFGWLESEGGGGSGENQNQHLQVELVSHNLPCTILAGQAKACPTIDFTILNNTPGEDLQRRAYACRPTLLAVCNNSR
jgi:hypothetical protein